MLLQIIIGTYALRIRHPDSGLFRLTTHPSANGRYRWHTWDKISLSHPRKPITKI